VHIQQLMRGFLMAIDARLVASQRENASRHLRRERPAKGSIGASFRDIPDSRLI
jgi:hypothetical protein